MTSLLPEPPKKQVVLPSVPLHDAPRTMIESLTIENFRCFKRVELAGLGRFNVLVGANSAGKTAFLEAIFMPGGKHDMAFLLRQMRGISQTFFAPVKEVYDSLWKDLFYKFSQSATIKIAIRGTDENARILRIYYKPQEALLIGFQGTPSTTNRPETSAIIPLTFETEFQGKKYANQAVVAGLPGGQQGLQITGEQPPMARISFVPFLGSSNLAQQFSQIDRTKNGKERLLSVIRQVFPIIEDLSVQTNGVGLTDLYCTIRELDEKIPIGLLSGGINRFVNILIMIATQENGVVIVDEIDNGIFHQAFKKVWLSLIISCEHYNVQLFASTHSKECLDALGALSEDAMKNFRLLRTVSQNSEGHGVQMFAGKDFRATLKVGYDPRQADLAV